MKSGWRLAIVFAPLFVLTSIMLVIDVVRGFCAGIAQALIGIMSVLIDWACDTTPGDAKL